MTSAGKTFSTAGSVFPDNLLFFSDAGDFRLIDQQVNISTDSRNEAQVLEGAVRVLNEHDSRPNYPLSPFQLHEGLISRFRLGVLGETEVCGAPSPRDLRGVSRQQQRHSGRYVCVWGAGSVLCSVALL